MQASPGAGREGEGEERRSASRLSGWNAKKSTSVRKGDSLSGGEHWSCEPRLSCRRWCPSGAAPPPGHLQRVCRSAGAAHVPQHLQCDSAHHTGQARGAEEHFHRVPALLAALLASGNCRLALLLLHLLCQLRLLITLWQADGSHGWCGSARGHLQNKANDEEKVRADDKQQPWPCCNAPNPSSHQI